MDFDKRLVDANGDGKILPSTITSSYNGLTGIKYPISNLELENLELKQQLIQRDEQIAAMSEILKHWGSEASEKFIHNTQAAAEAHNAKQRLIGREDGIQEAAKWLHPDNHSGDYGCECNDYPQKLIEALLSKEPG